MGYRWDATIDGVWGQRDTRTAVWRVSHLDTNPWTVALVYDAATEITDAGLQVEAIYMHPRTWFEFWDQLQADPLVTRETDISHIEIGWVGNVDMGSGPIPSPVPLRRPPAITPVFVGWRVRPDYISLIAKLPGEPFLPPDSMGLLLEATRITTVVRVLVEGGGKYEVEG